jgi:hypothetical protein
LIEDALASAGDRLAHVLRIIDPVEEETEQKDG